MTAAIQARTPLKVMLVAGEPSGDALGAQLMQSLQTKTQGDVIIIGVGGPEMRRQGLQSLYDIADTSVIGLRDAAPRVFKIWRRMRQVADFAVAQGPDVVVLIDSTDFMRNVAARIKARSPIMKVVKYVSPQVWASRPGRAKALTRVFDHMLCLFPFEPDFYNQVGLPATFVGNPVVDRAPPPGLGAKLRERYGIGPADRVIVVLPGSRGSEVRFLWPVLREAIDRTIASVGPSHVVVPVVSTVAPQVRAALAAWDRQVIVVGSAEDKWAAFEAADVALAKSGTVTTELALTQTPMVVAYKVGALTAWAARQIMTVRYLNMLNLVLDRPAIPELLQNECTAENLSRELINLLRDGAARARQIADAQEALKKLGMGQESAAARAAAVVLDIAARRS